MEGAANDWYNANIAAGTVEALTLPVTPIVSPGITVVPLEDPWCVDAAAYVVVRGLVPGVYRSWYAIVSRSSVPLADL